MHGSRWPWWQRQPHGWWHRSLRLRHLTHLDPAGMLFPLVVFPFGDDHQFCWEIRNLSHQLIIQAIEMWEMPLKSNGWMVHLNHWSFVFFFDIQFQCAPFKFWKSEIQSLTPQGCSLPSSPASRPRSQVWQRRHRDPRWGQGYPCSNWRAQVDVQLLGHGISWHFASPYFIIVLYVYFGIYVNHMFVAMFFIF